MRRTGGPWLLLAAAVPLLQMRVDASLGEFRAQEEVLYLWKGEQVKRLFPGFEGLMADVYWLRTVQYFGGQRAFAKEKRFDLLEPLIDITVTLDPMFEIAYRYGAVFLSEPPPIGAGRPEAGVALLVRGCHALPRAWFLHQLRGFFTYFFLRDAEKAAAALLEASKIPGAPFWMKTTAADFLAKGGEREKSRRLWQEMYRQFEEGPLRDNALAQMQRLDALDQADALNRSIEAFASRMGRRPLSLADLARTGLLPFLLVDPTGVPFEYDPAEGKAKISKRSTLWRRPGPLGEGLE